MGTVKYQVNSDDAEKLDYAESRLSGGEPTIKIGLPNGDEHAIFAGGELTVGIGFERDKDGTVTIRFNKGGKVLRRYNGWTWIEGAKYVRAPSQVYSY